MRKERAIIFANGIIRSSIQISSMIQSDDWIIAADGGYRHIKKLGLEPSMIIGDMDSIPVVRLKGLIARGVSIQKYPADKNETDLELALMESVRLGFQKILVIAALGGRLDQTMGNIFLLSMHSLENVDIRFEDGVEEVFLIRKSETITGNPGDPVSLLPLGGKVEGITTDGLRYPLCNELLLPDKTRGISNEMMHHTARILVGQGTLLCIHRRISHQGKLPRVYRKNDGGRKL
jgi:thiamine pyrophosphokinase